MTLRLLADAGAQTSIALALGSGATSFVGGSTANFAQPQNFAGGQGSLTILDQGNPSWNPAAPLATPYEYAYYNNNNTGTNTISGMTRGVAGTTAKSFFANALVAQGIIAEDIYASVPWKFDEQSPAGTAASVLIPASGSIPASYLGVSWRCIHIRYQLRTNSGNATDFLTLRLGTGGGAVDASANYNQQNLQGSAAVASAGSSGGTTSIRAGILIGGTGTATKIAQGEIVIFNYAGTTFQKVITALNGNWPGSGNPSTELDWGDWSNTGAITSVSLIASAGNVTGLVTTYLEP
jgi:hypothetical protein